MSRSHPLDETKRPRLEPGRMGATLLELVRAKCEVEPGPDRHSYSVTFPNGRRFNFWPYSGWFAGPASGRGFGNLVKAGTEEARA